MFLPSTEDGDRGVEERIAVRDAQLAGGPFSRADRTGNPRRSGNT